MITTIKGTTIEINGRTEWVLFNRLCKKVSPAEFLHLTDFVLALPSFLFTTTLFIILFFDINLYFKLSIPSLFYFFGQIMINFRFGYGDLALLKHPLALFTIGKNVTMLIVFALSFYYLNWWFLLLAPIYLFSFLTSIIWFTYFEKKNYLNKWGKSISSSEIFHNNAFLFVYKYYADKYNMIKTTDETNEEIKNQDWINHYEFMLKNWSKLETYFTIKGKRLWRSYLQLEN